ncbi:uncharacterized protein LOC124442381 [Xenia sp. Carnegie-2017]|uniref:uncharacterized protein LOC124442381 n=1 Tax=Xenia sp. Carnegie-2017 TaxID=2897299 RepID=UPI001F04A147|nr:uncharacterized protein LOC124442381 [Xenia sp. Carnegie-2017]
MKNLRDTYRRCKKKHDAAIKSGAPASSTPNWEFWSIMTWLDDYAKRRQTISNVVIPVEDQLTSSQIQEDSEEIAESVLADSPSSQSTNLSSTFEIVRCKKRKAEDMSPYQTKLIGYLETLHKKQVKEPESQDEYDFFVFPAKILSRGTGTCLKSSRFACCASDSVSVIIFRVASMARQNGQYYQNRKYL